MTTESKIIIGLLSVLVILGGIMLFSSSSKSLGGVGDISTINSSLAVNSIGATSSLAVGGDKAGKLCLHNGTQFTIITFAAGSTTPAYATSTSCSY